jgi:CobN/Magnesium Chelatase
VTRGDTRIMDSACFGTCCGLDTQATARNAVRGTRAWLTNLVALQTKGESVAMVLHLVGARPVKEGTGRIARFELIPLEELGRPRIDCLCNMSGIFRYSLCLFLCTGCLAGACP